MKTTYNIVWFVVILVISLMAVITTLLLIHGMQTYDLCIEYETINFGIYWDMPWNVVDFLDIMFLLIIPISWLGYYHIMLSFGKKMREWHVHMVNNGYMK